MCRSGRGSTHKEESCKQKASINCIEMEISRLKMLLPGVSLPEERKGPSSVSRLSTLQTPVPRRVGSHCSGSEFTVGNCQRKVTWGRDRLSRPGCVGGPGGWAGFLQSLYCLPCFYGGERQLPFLMSVLHCICKSLHSEALT